MVRALAQAGASLFIRDNSYLGFPAYQLFIPGMSEVDCMFDAPDYSELLAWTDFAREHRTLLTLPGADSAARRRLADAVRRLEDTLLSDPLEPAKWFFSSYSLPQSAQNRFLFEAIVYASAECWTDAVRALNLYLADAGSESAPKRLLRAVGELWSMRGEGVPEGAARERLADDTARRSRTGRCNTSKTNCARCQTVPTARAVPIRRPVRIPGSSPGSALRRSGWPPLPFVRRSWARSSPDACKQGGEPAVKRLPTGPRRKAVPPEETIFRIREILRERDLFVVETTFPKRYGTYSCRLELGDPPLFGQGFGVNGKGMSPRYALASAYGELMERLSAGALMPYGPDDAADAVDLTAQAFARQCPDAFVQALKLHSRSELAAFLCDCFGEEPLRCAPFRCLNDGSAALMPLELVQLLCGTTGLCAGNTPEEAMLQGLMRSLNGMRSKSCTSTG